MVMGGMSRWVMAPWRMVSLPLRVSTRVMTPSVNAGSAAAAGAGLVAAAAGAWWLAWSCDCAVARLNSRPAAQPRLRRVEKLDMSMLLVSGSW